jgi:hypothetical protein
MKTDALQLVSRYSLPPNSLGYCGKGSAPERFKTCIRTGRCSGVEDEVSHFIVLNPYLETLKEITGLDKFSYENIEAYWLGNDELKKAKPEHYDLLLDYFLKQGVPDFFVEELKENPPKKFIPNHLFQVLHVGVGKSSGAVPFNLESINSCMIRWGKVLEIGDKILKIELNSLKKVNGKYKLKLTKDEAEYGPKLLGKVHAGDTVTVHWDIVTKILTKEEIKNIEYWTKKTLAEIN